MLNLVTDSLAIAHTPYTPPSKLWNCKIVFSKYYHDFTTLIVNVYGACTTIKYVIIIILCKILSKKNSEIFYLKKITINPLVSFITRYLNSIQFTMR